MAGGNHAHVPLVGGVRRQLCQTVPMHKATVFGACVAMLLGACDRAPAADTQTANTTQPAITEPSPAADPASERAPEPAAEVAAMVDGAIVFDTPVKTLDGEDSSLGAHKGKVLLVVNVASKCGLTPQYEDLEKLHAEYSARGFAVVGFPCNQFGGQEPGSAEEIKKFCSLTYGVTFPMFEKIEVNGDGRHPIYGELSQIEDAKGEAGDIQWNFEKFLISPDGKQVERFRPRTKPYDEKLVARINSWLPSSK